MKRTKLVKMLTSAVLTGALVMSMGGMTAFAAESVGSIALTKKVKTDGSTYAPNTEFTFTVVPGERGSFNDNVVYAGVEGGLVLDATKYQFAPNEEDGAKAEYSVTGNITVDATKFTTTGIYHYTVQETEGTYEGVAYDTAARDLYVYVQNDDNNQIYVAAVISAKDGQKQDSLEITNDYGEVNDTTHDVVITKAVTGNQGDKTKEFEFDVSVNGGEGEWYKVIKTAQNGDSAETHLVSGAAPVLYTLKDGESIHIYGLSANDTYTVNEHDYSDDGYTTANKDNEGKLTADNTAITVTNDKNVTTPTGIALTFAPYILMVALAGVFAVLFLRRKREGF